MGKRVWLAWRFLMGFLGSVYVHEEGFGSAGRANWVGIYDELAEYLSETGEIIEFAFDWRKPLEEKNARLAVEQALGRAFEKTGQPVGTYCALHGWVGGASDGARTCDIWKRMLARSESRIVMLGTPNSGSWVRM